MVQQDSIDVLEKLHTQIYAHHKMNVKKDFSLMVACAAASTVVHNARLGNQTVHAGNFKVTTVVDADGHLSVYVQSADDSPLIEIPEDIGRDDEFGTRFTTGAIEAAYLAANSWQVTLKMESGFEFQWSGLADDKEHAEGQAGAEATRQTGEQIYEMVSCTAPAPSLQS